MSENFEIIKPETSGNPLLYLHGLGSPEPIADEMRQPLQALGFSVWGLHRDDEKILGSQDASAEIVGGCIEAVERIKTQTRKKVTLVGNSLGSYLAVMTALDNHSQVKRVLGTDAFLEPNHGFKLIEKWSVKQAQQVPDLLESQLSPYGIELKNRTAQSEQNYPVSLVNDRWMDLPKELYKQFQGLTLAEAKRLKVPTLLIWGDKDPFIKSVPTEIIPQASGLEINGADHNEWMNYPPAIEAAKAFLSAEPD